MRDAVVHLINAHSRRGIVFLRGPAENQEAQTRFQAYKDALRDFGLPYDPALVLHGEFAMDVGKRVMREFMERELDFDAVVGANDFSTLGALEVLRERDIGVPHQVAVIGFDDAEEARGSSPTLSTVRQPYFELAAHALDTLSSILDGRPAPEAAARAWFAAGAAALVRLLIGRRALGRTTVAERFDGAVSRHVRADAPGARPRAGQLGQARAPTWSPASKGLCSTRWARRSSTFRIGG